MDDNSKNSEQKQQVIDSLKQANNILVTVKRSPSIDQLAACIALTLILDNQGKHGTAVFSGEVPSVLEFLEPGKTLEKNTDSLQDFIISLDKSKADKLRYKVEDSVVRIFITPYKTSITDKDLEFGQGDFNVDVVVALGVHNQDDLDEAITTHGRILHDATVISMNTDPGDSEDLGSINWIDTDASSLSEMVASMANSLAKSSKKSKRGDDDKDDDGSRDSHNAADVIDNQIATALLTGIVAETERFGNAKTTPGTMETAARLLTAGANQELVASKLAEPKHVAPSHGDEPHESHEDSEVHEDDDDHDSHDGNDGQEDHHDDHPDDHHDEMADDSHDEHNEQDGHDDHSDASEEPLMPALLAPGTPGGKSIYEADDDDATANDADLTDSDKPAGDGSLDITHPEDETGQSELTDGADQTIDHQDDDLALAHAGVDVPQPADHVDTPDTPSTPDADSLVTPVAAPAIHPIHNHGMVIAPPSHSDELGGTSPDSPLTASESELPAGTSYGLAPPMMGGTLTSNTTEDPSANGSAAPKPAEPAMLSHSQPDFGHLTAPLQPTANHNAAPTPDAAPDPALSVPEGRLIAPLTAAPAASPTAGNPTLAQLEQNTSSPHAIPLPPTPPPLIPPIGA